VAIVNVPVLVSPGFAPIVNDTEPGPVCIVVGETVRKFALFATDHVQAAPVVTVKVALPPAPDMLNVPVDTE
jgi:hypothetical protein